MRHNIRPYLVAVIIVAVVLAALGWFAYRVRQPAMPTKPEEALTIPPSGMPGPNPAKMRQMQEKMLQQKR